MHQGCERYSTAYSVGGPQMCEPVEKMHMHVLKQTLMRAFNLNI